MNTTVHLNSKLLHSNECLSPYFQNSRGLRQGDPLFPLFVLLWRPLALSLSRCYLSGLQVRSMGGVGVNVSHLLLDDYILRGITRLDAFF